MEVTVKRTLLTLFVGAVAAGIPAYAHHSFAAHYFEEQSVTLTGDVDEFEYRNPHAWVHFMAPDSTGEMRRYGAEWAGPGRLAREGITKDTIKPGDRVIVTGSPGRVEGEFKMHLKGIERPADGWSWRGGRNRR
jgi:hypothetical protein